MNKSESKYFNTSLLMNQALIQLLNKKDYDFITIKEICKKAGVNRSTFYLHYDNIDDLLYETIENLNKEFHNLHLSKSDIDLMINYFRKAKNQKCLVEYLENRLKEVEDSNTSLSGVERGEYYGR